MKRKLLAITMGTLVWPTALVFSAAEDNNAYREGYNLILEQNWEQAVDYFGEFQTDYSNSAWVDDATFWGCYAEEQLVGPSVDTFNCYQELTSRFPESSWAADARSKLLVIGTTQASRGNPALLESIDFGNTEDVDVDFDFDFDFDSDELGETIAMALNRAERELERVRENRVLQSLPPLPPVPDISSLSDPEQVRIIVREFENNIERHRQVARGRSRSSADDELLTILAALRNDDRASELLMQRLDSSDDPQLRARIVLLLEDVAGSEITQRLMRLAEEDESEEVRNNAIIVLLDRDDPVANEMLLSIVSDPSYPVPIRAEILDNVDQFGQDVALRIIEEILANETEPALISEAADVLADMETEASIELLVRTFNDSDDLQTRYLLLDEMGSIESPAVMNLLTDVALTADDEELAAMAIDEISDREDNIGVAALEHILLSTTGLQRRRAALNGLGEAETARAVEVLSQYVTNQSDPELIVVATRALGSSDQETAIPVLLDIYNSSSEDNIKHQAVRGLRNLDEYPAAADAMLQILEQRLSEADSQ